MYRALYDFQSNDEKALSFRAKDQFTVLSYTDDKYWWLVQNGFGQVGYVPANYLNKDQAADAEVIKSIDRAIEAIHYSAAAAGGHYTHQQRENLQKLIQHRKTVLTEPKPDQPPSPNATDMPCQPQRPAPSRPSQDNHRDPKHSSVKSRTAPPPPPTEPQVAQQSPPPSSKPANKEVRQHRDKIKGSRAEESKRISRTDKATSPFRNASNVAYDSGGITTATQSSPLRSPKRLDMGKIPDNLGADLVDVVRQNTGLSYDKSQIAIKTVLGHLRDNIPGVSFVMDDLLKRLFHEKRNSQNIEGSHDAVRLQIIFSEMAACKDDSQQRSWALHEDEVVIMEYLEELISILNNANPEICKKVVSQDNYDAVHTLVLYYQMETRVSIRLLLLKCFGALCGLEAAVVSELLNSVLPLELARDMQTDVEDVQKMSFSALVLCMIFSTGESLPFQHYEHLSLQFVRFMLNFIENPPEADTEEQVPDLFVNLLLSYNLHFQVPSDNVVMKVLGQAGTAKTFTEKLMLLVNRGEDPVRMFDHEPHPPDSLLKFLCDMYSSPTTADLLYTNDAKVLIDIVIRQFTDLQPGDKVRTEYLSLVHLIVRNSAYSEHMHRAEELDNCFGSILREEEKESEMDRLIVREIISEFQQYFGKAR